jgi:hypothetical protein
MRRFLNSNLIARVAAACVPSAAVFLSLCVMAQKAPDNSAPKYDVQSESKIKGSIEDVKAAAKGAKEVVHLVIKSGADSLDIYLCPQAFLDDMGVSFGKGDAILVTGSKVKQGEADLVLAREVAKGTDTLVLRDAKGEPIWSWHR